MTTKKKHQSLIEIARQIKPRKLRLSWIERLPEPERQELEQLREAMRNKELGDISNIQIYQQIIAPRYNIHQTTFNQWIRDGR